jgi:spore coat protein CotH
MTRRSYDSLRRHLPIRESFTMARSLALSTLIVLACALGAAAQVPRRVQPLLGVGEPPTGSAAGAADPFFNDGVLQEIRLDINAKDWETLKTEYLSNVYYPADFRWGGQVVRNIGIRSRGTASRSGVKPGLRVDFNRYADGQTFLGLKSFVLRNNATDPTSLHERLSMKLFARLGSVVPRVAPVRLVVNGQDAGLYSIVESIDKEFLSQRFNENDGVLFKYDRNVEDAPYYLDYAGPDWARYVPHPFKPETHESDPQPEPLVELIRQVAESSEVGFRSAVAPLLDLAAFVRSRTSWPKPTVSSATRA